MGIVTDQLAALLWKDWVLRKRAWCESLCIMLLPVMCVLLGCSAVFFIPERHEIRPFTTEENVAAPIVGAGSTFLFDPFPLDCVAIDAVSLLSRSATTETNGGGSPIQEKTIGLEETTNFDCFLSAMSSYIPVWNIVVKQLREFPAWLPTPRTYAVAASGGTPGPATASTTNPSIAQAYAKYLDKRYERSFSIVTVFHNITDECFRNDDLHSKASYYLDYNLGQYGINDVWYPTDEYVILDDMNKVGEKITRTRTTTTTPIPESISNALWANSFLIGSKTNPFASALLPISVATNNSVATNSTTENSTRMLGEFADNGLEEGYSEYLAPQSYSSQPRRYLSTTQPRNMTSYDHCIQNVPMTCFFQCFLVDLDFRRKSLAMMQKVLSGRRLTEVATIDEKQETSHGTSAATPAALDKDPSHQSRQLLESDMDRFLKKVGIKYGELKKQMDARRKKKEENDQYMKRRSLLKKNIFPLNVRSARGTRQRDSASDRYVEDKTPYYDVVIDQELKDKIDKYVDTPFQRTIADMKVDPIGAYLGVDSSNITNMGVDFCPTTDEESNPGQDESNSQDDELEGVPQTTTSGNRRRRNLRAQVDCRSIRSACECAKARVDNCAWRQESSRIFGRGRCRAMRGITKKDTSCAECLQQPGCSAPDLWRRLGKALPRLNPYVEIYADEKAIMDFVQKGEYPAERLRTRFDPVSDQMLEYPVSDTVCQAVVFDNAAPTGDFGVVIRPNATSSGGLPYGFDTYRKVALRAIGRSYEAYSLSGFFGSQSVLGDFIYCKNEVEKDDCWNRGPFANIAKDSSLKSYQSHNVSFGTFGVPKHMKNTILGFNGDNLFGNLWLGFAAPVLPIAGKILMEKESKIREGMRMIGLRDTAFYLEDFVFNGVAMIPIAVGTAYTLAAIPDMVVFSDTVWIALMFWLCLWATCQFGVFLTSFFNKSLFGKIVVFGIVFLSQLFLNLTDGSWTTAQRYWLSVIPASALQFEIFTYKELELKTDGVRWETLHWRHDAFSILDGMIMHVVCIFLYTFLFAYFDQVIPSDFGIPRPFWFPFTKSFWLEIADTIAIYNSTDTKLTIQTGDDHEMGDMGGNNDEGHDGTRKLYFEPRNLQQREMERSGNCVQVSGLRKEFNVDGQKVVAVNGLSTTMYLNQIYVLLGHNGAGKTTTFSMLTGLIPPTEGSSKFFGRSMQDHLTNHRSKVGFCPQFSVLWPQLTSMEHLLLFARFKGVPSTREGYNQCRELLREQYMDHRADTLGRNLSGGMKRKLSLAIAFIGDPNLVFLDEPSSGLDATARREIWNLLRTRKDGRVIVLTTHYMDEADALGDKISIMSEGRIKCSGSPNFLKTVYGCGYNLTFNLSVPASKQGPKLHKFLQDLLAPNKVKILSMAGKDVLFVAPFEASACFKAAFEKLENSRHEMCILSWNLYVCNLEEVFLKVASNEEEQLGAINAVQLGDASAQNAAECSHMAEATGEAHHEPLPKEISKQLSRTISGGQHSENSKEAAPILDEKQFKIAPPMVQFRALLWKRFLNTKRDYKTSLVQQCCPCTLVVVFMVVLLISIKDDIKVDFDFSQHYNLDIVSPSDRVLVPFTFDSPIIPDSVESSVQSMAEVSSSAFSSSATQKYGYSPHLYAEASTIPNGVLMNDLKNYKCPHASGCGKVSKAASTANVLASVTGAGGGDGSAASITGSECPAEIQAEYNYYLSRTFGIIQSPQDTLGGAFGNIGFSAEYSYSNATTGVLEDTSSGSFSAVGSVGGRMRPSEHMKNMSKQLVYGLEDSIKSYPEDKSRYGSIMFGRDRNVLLQVNHTGFHAAPILLHIFNSMLSAGSDVPGYSLSMQPLPLTAYEQDQKLRFQSFAIAFNVMISFAFVSCFALVFIVMEKELEIKAQQFVNGVSIPVYWLAQYVWDFLMFVFPITSMLIALPALEITPLIGEASLAAFIALMVLFALAIPSFYYICAHFFKTSNAALTVALVMNVIVSTVLYFATFIFELVPFTPTRRVGRMVSAIARLWPVFAFGEGTRQIALVSYTWTLNPPEAMSESYYKDCEERYNNFEVSGNFCAQTMWDKFAAGPAITALAVEAVLYILITIAIDLGQEDLRVRQKFEPKFDVSVNKSQAVRDCLDPDVIEEENRVHEMPIADVTTRTSVYCRHVNKTFRVQRNSSSGPPGGGGGGGSGRELSGAVNVSEGSLTQCCRDCCKGCCRTLFPCCRCCGKKEAPIDVHAVRNISFSLAPGDVMGLLGANGAGKTTTFRMMCGVAVPSSHAETEIRICGRDIFTQRPECRRFIGYTAQANPLWIGMTVREHLEFYAQMKGIPPSDLKATIKKSLEDLDLTTYEHKRAGNLSGGNKRKLVIAMSLIGAPPVIFLDEPSAGMDPAARRKMWEIIHTIATKKKTSTVILTSHSMDEVEALCSKVVIMVNGVFRCLGSLGRVKDVYGRGFDLYVKFRGAKEEDIKLMLKSDLQLQGEYITFREASALLQFLKPQQLLDMIQKSKMAMSWQVHGDGDGHTNDHTTTHENHDVTMNEHSHTGTSVGHTGVAMGNTPHSRGHRDIAMKPNLPGTTSPPNERHAAIIGAPTHANDTAAGTHVVAETQAPYATHIHAFDALEGEYHEIPDATHSVDAPRNSVLSKNKEGVREAWNENHGHDDTSPNGHSNNQNIAVTTDKPKKVMNNFANFIEDAQQLDMNNLNAILMSLLYGKNSPFPTASRLATKMEKSHHDEENIQKDRIRSLVFAEWYLFTLWRINLVDWIAMTFPGAKILEQRQNVLLFRIDAKSLAASPGSSPQSGAFPGSPQSGTTAVHCNSPGSGAIVSPGSGAIVTTTGLASSPKSGVTADERLQGQFLGSLFGLLEEHKSRFNIMEYAVTPTTLEQIFNQFTYLQVGEDDE